MEQWTQDEAIAFECAKEVIGHMIAIKSSQIWEEEQKDIPDQRLLEKLNESQFKLAQERKNLRLKDHEKIAQVRNDYGSIIKEMIKEERSNGIG
jgi:hypothetical protein